MTQEYDDLHQRYLIACQELADTREALAEERRRRLDFEMLLTDIEEMIGSARYKP